MYLNGVYRLGSTAYVRVVFNAMGGEAEGGLCLLQDRNIARHPAERLPHRPLFHGLV